MTPQEEIRSIIKEYFDVIDPSDSIIDRIIGQIINEGLDNFNPDSLEYWARLVQTHCITFFPMDYGKKYKGKSIVRKGTDYSGIKSILQGILDKNGKK